MAKVHTLWLESLWRQGSVKQVDTKRLLRRPEFTLRFRTSLMTRISFSAPLYFIRLLKNGLHVPHNCLLSDLRFDSELTGVPLSFLEQHEASVRCQLHLIMQQCYTQHSRFEQLTTLFNQGLGTVCGYFAIHAISNSVI